MGGRGASSGFSTNGKPYGTEYKTLLQSGNIKFVQRTDNSANAPLETMTKGRVYVTVNNAGVPKYISYYDTENKRTQTIDLDKPHRGMLPHVHHGYNHNEKDGPKGATNLSPKERSMVENVINLWHNKLSK